MNDDKKLYEIIMDNEDEKLYEIEKKILFIDNKIEVMNDKIETIYQNTILIVTNLNINNFDRIRSIQI